MDIYIWGAFVRISQAMMDACPTIVVGWLVAAVFERIQGREGTLRLFGGHTWRQLPYAWLLGMILPVCSLGVIPVMAQMRKSGISGGTILAFGLTAPLFNPISVLYGLTLSDPTALFVFCLGSLTIVTVMGSLWDWLFPENWIEPEALPDTPFGWRRIAAVGLSICQQAFSRSSLFILLGFVGVGILSMLLPAGCLQKAAGKDDMTAPLTMALVATLAYITPMVAIVQVASMFQHGNSIGAAFTLLVLGTGVNLGMLCWTVSNYRWHRSLAWLGCLVVVVLVLGYAVDRPLRPIGVEPADHTHAFDTYCNPFPVGSSDLGQNSWKLVRESVSPEELAAGWAVLFCLVIGGLNSVLDVKGRWMSALVSTYPTIEPKGEHGSTIPTWKRDIVLPNSVIGTACLVGLVVASVGACFLYYPPVSEIRKEMNAIQADLQGVSSMYDWDQIDYWIPIQEDWAHKLTVSCYLRGSPLNRFQRLKMRVFLSKLEMLEHAAEDHKKQDVDEWKYQASNAFRRLKLALE